MAAIAVDADEISAHATLVADTVDTVTFAGPLAKVEVLSVDGAAVIYFTVDGSTPTVGGQNTYVLPAAIGGVELVSQELPPPGLTDEVKLKSAGTPAYSVTRTG